MKPLTIPLTICLCLSFCTIVFSQNVGLNYVEKECLRTKSQYLDYSKFVLNTKNSDEFNTNESTKTIEYLKSNDWTVNSGNIGLDSFSYSTLRLTGSALEINVENWKLEDGIPQFLIGSIQKNISNVLGLYEWRIKFDDFFALAASSSIAQKKSFHFSPIDYQGNSPNELSIDSWHYFPINQLNHSVQNYNSLQCEDSIENILVAEELADNIIAESNRKLYKGSEKYYEYSCKKCNCRQSINFDEPIHEKYKTLSLVVTTEHAAFFIDGVLLYINILGGNDSTSICPLSEAACIQNGVLSLESAIVANGNEGDFALRNDMWNYLTTGNEVKWSIDYFRKYDFKDNLFSKEYLKSYQKIALPKPKGHKLSKKSYQMNYMPDNSLIAVGQNGKFIEIDDNGEYRYIIDKKTKKNITAEGDFAISPNNEIFFVGALGFIEILKKDSLGNYYSESLLNYNPTQQVKNTKYRDLVILENNKEIEIIFKTKKNNIGRYFQNRGKWYFIEMTSKSSFRVEGDIQTGTNGKIFYRGSDGYLHGMQVKGKKRESFHINVRPQGSKTPKLSKSTGAFVVTPKDEIIYVNTENQLIYLHLVKRRYKVTVLTKKSRLKCEQIHGNLVWMKTSEMSQLLFIDKTNRLCGLKYNQTNDSWRKDQIGLKTKTSTVFKSNQQNIIAYNSSNILHLNLKKELIRYQLIPSSIKKNDKNYAFFIDRTNECKNIKLESTKALNTSSKRLSDF